MMAPRKHTLCLRRLPSPPFRGERVRVRWAFDDRSNNHFEDSVQIVEYVIIPEPDHAIAASVQFFGTPRVSFDRSSVLPSIDLNDQLTCGDRKICDVWTNRMLTAHLNRRASLAKRAPQKQFRIRRLAAQASCLTSPRANNHPRPHPNPLRPQGRRGNYSRAS